MQDSARPAGEYGVDAPFVPILLALGGLAALAGGVAALRSGVVAAAVPTLAGAVVLLLSAGCYVHTTRRGKFVVWARLLSDLGLRGHERVLDVGCGRGAVLLAAARLLPRGSAVGLDLWRSIDQSGNDPAITEANASREGVAGRVELHTGDMRRLPFPDASFDVVLSSLAIHNVRGAAGRAEAIDEAARVLRPGGRIVVADIHATRAYAARLIQLGFTGVARRGLGWRFWYGGPWMATSLVTAVKRD